jgi:hypothetical protein
VLKLPDQQGPAYEPPPAADFQRLPDSEVSATPMSKSATADMMLEAHNNLVKADQRNREKFKDLSAFLREKAGREQKKKSKPTGEP